MTRILFDIEGDGLLPDLTKIHCICTVDVDTLEERDFGPDELDEAIAYLSTADLLIAHFGLGYDFPALEKIKKFVWPFEKKSDTVVLARLKRPNVRETDGKWNDARISKGEPTMGDQFGKHTIEAWGIRLGCAKLHTDITDWSQWTPQIQERCHGDVQTNLKLWQYLNPDKMSQAAIELEHRTQRLCNMITEAGWPFNMKKAAALHVVLLSEQETLEAKLKAEFDGWYAPKSGLRIKGKPETRGQLLPKKDNKKLGYTAGQLLTKIEWVEFNPKSLKHIERVMRRLGWEPTAFTDAGNPSMEEEVLDSITAEYPQAAGLTRYLMLSKRLSQLVEGEQGLMGKVGPDGRIHGQYNPMGTVTSRAAHFNPNLGQVVSVSSPFGREFRECFEVPEGWEMVGADMSSLEGLCQGHYQFPHDNGAFGNEVLNGDMHWKNVLAMGLMPPGTERDKHNQLHTMLREHGSKRWYYALIYGMGAEESGSILLNACRAVRKENPEWGFIYNAFFGDDQAPTPKTLKRVGGLLKKQFLDNSPELKALIRKITELAEDHGKLPGLDGRILPIRAAFSAFNALLQSAGAILCKRWICDAYDMLIASGLKWGWDDAPSGPGDFVFLGWIHDELQVACRNGLGHRIGAVLTAAAQKAGEPYGFRMPLDSTYKIGRTWADTH